jgi:hypothetical protein
MTTACKIKRQTMRGKEEGRQQTTTALGQPGREHETKIKKSVYAKRLFAAIWSVWLEFLLPPKTNSFPFRFISLMSCSNYLRLKAVIVLRVAHMHGILRQLGLNALSGVLRTQY